MAEMPRRIVEPKTDFGRFLRDLRGRESQEGFAKRVALSGPHYGRVERGYMIPPSETVEAMAVAFGAEDPRPWLTAAGYEAEADAFIGPRAWEVSSPDIPDLSSVTPSGTIERDGLILPADGFSWGDTVTKDVWFLVSADVLGDFRRGDMVRVRGAPTDPIPSDSIVIIREADGTERLVRFVAAKGASVTVRPWSSLGEAKPVDFYL